MFVVAACGGDKSVAGDSGEADADTDSDADTDTDTDSDADTDTDTGEPVGVTGTWAGSCAGDLYGSGGSGSSSAGTSFPIQLVLVETSAGAIEGSAFYTQYALLVAGGRTGADVALFPTGYTSMPGTASTPIELRLTQDGDLLAGDLVYYPNQTHGLDTVLYPCTLGR